MLAAGIGIPIMATLNAGLGQRLASPVAASAVLFAGAFALAAIVLAVFGQPPSVARFAATPPVYYLGAFFTVFYILAITYAGPKIGIGNAVFFVLLGQMVAASVIDHFGLWGAIVTPVTARRIIGLIVMTVGVYLARKPTA
ncbi:DMT family transporter [Sphingomonas oligophenolica]|uniref:DMT family transporter n=2 Tax=Sphingomonas oligophenolica TaxID=301154 RepID=A0A502CCT9_9SPHN|nr:DMT family transporter [Sphingomonas oligophenolica]